MTNRERWLITTILFSIALMVLGDIIFDSREGVVLWHVLAEGAIGVAAISGIFVVLKGSVSLKHQLQDERRSFEDFKLEAEKWRTESRKYLDGLSLAIDQQLTKWMLSAAEKEVAFLLLKGLSLKEIAEVRGTAEKTARVQSMAIYAKSNLAGRSELSAFFLEDLLVPPTSSKGEVGSSEQRSRV